MFQHKYGLPLLIVATYLSACTVEVTIPEGTVDDIKALTDSADVTVADVGTQIEEALSYTEIAELTDTFSLDSVATGLTGGFAQGGSFFTAQPNSGAAPFAPLSATDRCPAPDSGTPLPNDNICFVNDGAVNIVLYVETTEPLKINVIDISADVPASPLAPAMTVDVEDLEAETGTIEANILIHKVKVTVNTTGNADAPFDSRIEEIEAEFGGCFDKNRNDPDDKLLYPGQCDNDVDDLFYSFKSTTVFKDGNTVTESGVPSEPVTAGTGDNVDAGTYTRIVESTTGRLITDSTTVEFDRTVPSLHIERTQHFRNGRVVTESIDIGATGDIALVRDVTYEDTHPRKSLHEAGTIKGDKSGGTFDRTVVRDDGNEFTEAVTVTIDGGTTTIEYDRNDGTHGTMVVTGQTDTSVLISINVTGAEGSNIQVEARKQVDGSVEANFWIDRADIDAPQDLDAEREGEQDAVGTLSDDGQGHVTGEGQFYDAAGNLHDVTFEVNVDGTSKTEDGGIVTRRDVTRAL